MNKKYDWVKTESYFMNVGFESRLSLKELGSHFNIPYQTVRRYAAAHDWHRKRYREKIKRETGMDYKDYIKSLYAEIMNR